jgi:hypothetical protein
MESGRSGEGRSQRYACMRLMPVDDANVGLVQGGSRCAQRGQYEGQTAHRGIQQRACQLRVRKRDEYYIIH